MTECTQQYLDTWETANDVCKEARTQCSSRGNLRHKGEGEWVGNAQQQE